jgi:hypothetical protein
VKQFPRYFFSGQLLLKGRRWLYLPAAIGDPFMRKLVESTTPIRTFVESRTPTSLTPWAMFLVPRQDEADVAENKDVQAL